MRVMDGMMAIPGILLAVAMMALMRASIETVVIAIAVPEIPRDPWRGWCVHWYW